MVNIVIANNAWMKLLGGMNEWLTRRTSNIWIAIRECWNLPGASRFSNFILIAQYWLVPGMHSRNVPIIFLHNLTRINFVETKEFLRKIYKGYLFRVQSKIGIYFTEWASKAITSKIYKLLVFTRWKIFPSYTKLNTFSCHYILYMQWNV
jgi:hypothetical protein